MFIYYVPHQSTVTLQTIYYPTKQTYEAFANLFFKCRKLVITIRSTIDTLITITTMENRLILLCTFSYAFDW